MEEPQYIKDRKIRMAERMISFNYTSKNSKYGEFVIQTNDVQFCLITLILLRSPMPDEKLRGSLEWLTLGPLIDSFRLCAINKEEVDLEGSLREYLNSRNTLAHRMNTKHKLTEKECELSIELGEEILNTLTDIIRSILAKQKKRN